MKITVVIPNYNGARWLWSCLKGVEVNMKNNEMEVIMVDNGSNDGSQELFKKWGKGILLENDKNTGFATAVNLGAEKASNPWILILNNDLVLDRLWVEEAGRAVGSGKGVCFGGTVLDAQGVRLESRGLAFDKRGKCWNLGNKEKFNWKKISKLPVKKVWGISGAAMLVKCDVFLKLGGFDKDFFAYQEDADFCYRLNVCRLNCYWVPRAVAFHMGGATSRLMGNLRARLACRNWIWLIAKNYSKREIKSNFSGIVKERLANLKYLVFDTWRVYGLASFYYLPKSLLWLLMSTGVGVPKMIKKRQQFKLLLQSF